MKKIERVAKLTRLEKKNNSVNGNPNWAVRFELLNGEVFQGRTASDATVGYFLSCLMEGDTVILTYHYTKSNNIIIDHATCIGGHYAFDDGDKVKQVNLMTEAVIGVLFAESRSAKVYDNKADKVCSLVVNEHNVLTLV